MNSKLFYLTVCQQLQLRNEGELEEKAFPLSTQTHSYTLLTSFSSLQPLWTRQVCMQETSWSSLPQTSQRTARVLGISLVSRVHLVFGSLEDAANTLTNEFKMRYEVEL